MNAEQLKRELAKGALAEYSDIYFDAEAQTKRLICAIDSFIERFGNKDISVFSVPGRCEIAGNHTDHNSGLVIAGAINSDIIAVAAKNSGGTVRVLSRGYGEDTVDLTKIYDKSNFEKYTSSALIGGVLCGIKTHGFEVGGFDAYLDSEVLSGSGISSSAAYEVMIGNIINHLYLDRTLENKELAKIAQYAENEFFGKPSGLMDQMACAVGGFVYIDFCDSKNPAVESIDFSLSEKGYELCLVNTGTSHADLNDDYAKIPLEMKAVAKHFGKNELRGITEDEIIKEINALRKEAGDRAVLRALHFVSENERVKEIRKALLSSDMEGFLENIKKSGDSSFKYLQNVHTEKSEKEQGLSLALAVSEVCFKDKKCAVRVHGGGFAGTVEAFIPQNETDSYVSLMESVFGQGSVKRYLVRKPGAVKLF